MSPFIRRTVMIVLAVAVVGAVAIALRPGPVPVDLAAVARGPLLVTVDEDGETRVRERYVVSAPLAGRLRRVDLEAADAVEAGSTILAVIDPTDPALLDDRAQAESEARVRAAQSAIGHAQATLEAARGRLDLAENELARVREAHDRGATTEVEVDRVETAMRTASEDHRAAGFAVEVARFELEQAEAALLLTRDMAGGGDQGRQLEIRAPISGRVLRVHQESDAVVAPGTPLLEVGDPDELEIVVDVLSTDAVRVVPGARVIIEHWGGDRAIEAAVRVVEPSAFMKVSALGVEEQRVNVIADFVSPRAERAGLGDRYRVEARIVVWSGDGVLLVPTSALFRAENGWAAFVAEGGRARQRRVEVGHFGAAVAEVVSGLSAGDEVVVHPSDRIADGVRVEPRGI
jgi:HlyD family secretion protein